MNLVEQHIIKKANPYFKELDNMSFLSKNLYNYANYQVRQAFIKDGYWIRFAELYNIVKSGVDYKALPASCSQQILRQLDANWTSFFKAMKSYAKTPKKFLGRPQLPKYLDKKKGRFLLAFPFQAIDKTEFNKTGLIRLPKTQIKIKTQKSNEKIRHIRVIKKLNDYVVEIIYSKDEIKQVEESKNVFSVDLGVSNLMTITSNLKGLQPVIVNGRALKSINQYYNKKLAELKSELELKHGLKISKKIRQHHSKRNNKIKFQLHNISKNFVEQCILHDIDTIIIGKNKAWKQEVGIGKRNNQNFVQLPYNTLINQITYKANLLGIKVIQTEENYTSKCSFLDLEKICKQSVYKGRRVKRGLFRSSNKTLINADVNGSYNILRKVLPNSFDEGIEGFVINPLKRNFHKVQNK